MPGGGEAVGEGRDSAVSHAPMPAHGKTRRRPRRGRCLGCAVLGASVGGCWQPKRCGLCILRKVQQAQPTNQPTNQLRLKFGTPCTGGWAGRSGERTCGRGRRGRGWRSGAALSSCNGGARAVHTGAAHPGHRCDHRQAVGGWSRLDRCADRCASLHRHWRTSHVGKEGKSSRQTTTQPPPKPPSADRGH